MTSVEDLLHRMRIGSGGGERGWRCLDEERLAAYIEQKVIGRKRERIERHLATCDFCRDQVGFLLRSQEEETAEPVPADWLVRARELGATENKTPPVPAWRWGAAAVATACAALAVTLWLKPQPEIRPAVPVAPPVTSPQVLARNDTKPLRPPVPSAVVRNHVRAESFPEVVSPKPNSVVAREGLEFRWKGMKGVLSYEARLVTSEGDVLWEQRVEALSTKLPSTVTLEAGKAYFLWVRAYSPDGRVVQSKAMRFTIADEN